MLKAELRRVCVLGKPPLGGRWDVDRAWGAAPRWVAGHVSQRGAPRASLQESLGNCAPPVAQCRREGPRGPRPRRASSGRDN